MKLSIVATVHHSADYVTGFHRPASAAVISVVDKQ